MATVRKGVSLRERDLKESSRENRHIRKEQEHDAALVSLDERRSRFKVHSSLLEDRRDPRPNGEQRILREPEQFPAQHQSHPGLEAEMSPKPRSFGDEYRAAGKLEGKVALITGGDSGIGRAVAIFYAREGADVAIVYLREEQRDADEVRQEVEELGRRCLLIPGDVTDAKFCRRAVAKVVEELGKLDILVNNAAFQQSQEKPEDVSDEQFEHTFRTNIFGYFYMAKAALEHLEEGGAIINTGSETGLEGNKHLLDYSATKGAIHAFTKSLAQMIVDDKRKIRVNCVAPGPVWTPLNVVDSDEKGEKVKKFGKSVPMKRAGQPEELAPTYVFLASNADSSYITGEIIRVMGGNTQAG